MRWLKIILVQLFVFIVLFEVGSYIATKFELLLVNETPGLYSPNGDLPDLLLGMTEKEPWGAWHVPNGQFRHAKSCFDVAMSFNEIGARDASFAEAPANSILLLGDSFAEGFGVTYENTSQHVLEGLLDRTILNLGSQGAIGPLQQVMIYRTFGELPHSDLLVYVLPGNDFTDNDRNHFDWQKHKYRYRPYYGMDGNPLEPFYFPEAQPRDSFSGASSSSGKAFIKQYLWAGNTIRTMLKMLGGETTGNSAVAYYYDASQTQQENFVTAYEAILGHAGERDVLFVIIPNRVDIDKHRSSEGGDSYKQQHWYRGLQGFAATGGKTVSVLDLMDHLPDETESLFFRCDGHWSNEGNRWAADAIHQHVLDNNLFD